MSENILFAGYARREITPPLPVPIAGFGMNHDADSVLDAPYLSCAAISDGRETLLFFTQDILYCYQPVSLRFRAKIAEETGIPLQNILLASSHTHAGIRSSAQEKRVEIWRNKYYAAGVSAAKEALADLAPCRLVIGKKRLPGKNEVRRGYLADGTFFSACSVIRPTKENPKVKPESESDDEVQAARFVREGKKNIVFVNWQGHPSITGGVQRHVLSSDYIAGIRARIEEAGEIASFFCGASGNVCVKRGDKDHLGYGAEIAEGALAALEDGKEVPGVPVLSLSRTVKLKVRRDSEEAYEKARELMLTRPQLSPEEFKKKVLSFGFASPEAAYAVLGRRKLPDEMEMELFCYRIGELSLVTAPYEMFDTNQIELKEKTPFPMTLVATCAQDNHSYIASSLSFPNKHFGVDMCRYEKGSGEFLIEQDLEMLNQISGRTK